MDDDDAEGIVILCSKDCKSNCGRVISLQTSLRKGNFPCCVMASFHKLLSKTGLPDPIRKALRASKPLLHPTNTARKVVGGRRILLPDVECNFA